MLYLQPEVASWDPRTRDRSREVGVDRTPHCYPLFSCMHAPILNTDGPKSKPQMVQGRPQLDMGLVIDIGQSENRGRRLMKTAVYRFVREGKTIASQELKPGELQNDNERYYHFEMTPLNPPCAQVPGSPAE